MAVVLSIDAGTTGVRTFAIDEDGRIVHRAYREFPQHFPRPGWVEHDPEEIWDATSTTLREVADALFISPKTVQWNLSKIYRKLGVRSRTELAAKLAAEATSTKGSDAVVGDETPAARPVRD